MALAMPLARALAAVLLRRRGVRAKGPLMRTRCAINATSSTPPLVTAPRDRSGGSSRQRSRPQVDYATRLVTPIPQTKIFSWRTFMRLDLIFLRIFCPATVSMIAAEN
jgi:hypothetical protein